MSRQRAAANGNVALAAELNCIQSLNGNLGEVGKPERRITTGVIRTITVECQRPLAQVDLQSAAYQDEPEARHDPSPSDRNGIVPW